GVRNFNVTSRSALTSRASQTSVNSPRPNFRLRRYRAPPTRPPTVSSSGKRYALEVVWSVSMANSLGGSKLLTRTAPSLGSNGRKTSNFQAAGPVCSDRHRPYLSRQIWLLAHSEEPVSGPEVKGSRAQGRRGHASLTESIGSRYGKTR